MIVIVGGGYAGAATAWALARRGHGRRVTLLEAEPEHGRHASGLNAGLVSPLLESDPALAAMALRGAALMEELAPRQRCGSIRLVGSEEAAAGLAAAARERGVPAEAGRSDGLAPSFPLVEGAPSAWAVRCPTDGTVEPRRLLDAYLGAARAAGARVVTGARVTGPAWSCGRLAGVETSAGLVEGEWVVDAAGAWAGELAALLTQGEVTLPLTPYRRHLFLTPELPGADPGWPFAWDLERDVYVRMQGRRVMLCACDEDPHPAAPPGTVPGVSRRALEALRQAMPASAGLAVEYGWACLRTFAPDRRYVVGPEPRLPGLFWVAGLGGSGAVAGAAVGELAADLLLTGGAGGSDAAREAARWFDPGRAALRGRA
ncbi:MAG TPA: FAD-dependent oxidoreductase [Candidatus Polarisedimenticolia bacterium]|nr:FAD-dependent oxidoreductase [Candidatus Polarisedimenticolia bacterium]